jgi:site-specific DNA-cytosine methylase
LAQTLNKYQPADTSHRIQLVAPTAFHPTQDPISGDVSPALGVTTGGMNVQTVGVRRLTPVECERLQAWPDNWTQLGNTPDSRRYAACGDGVTATVSEWIGRRLISLDTSRGQRTKETEQSAF